MLMAIKRVFLMVRIGVPLMTGALLLSGCVASPYYQQRNSRHNQSLNRRGKNKELLRPIVAVTDFENRANFNGQWNLGSGFADVLVTHLMDTDRVVVLERTYLGNVLGELDLQGDARFRAEGRVAEGKLKNAKYLIRGAITDFSVTGDSSGWFGTDKLFGGAGKSRSRVALHITISSVETGEILSSIKETGTASAGFLRGGARYSKIAFGGDAYFRTPLGKATDEAMRKAVRRIFTELPQQHWQGRVAETRSNQVIINGGNNVGLTPGIRFDIRAPARHITDPSTGNVIETIPGGRIGVIEIQDVRTHSASAILLNGEAKRGDILLRVPETR